MYSNFTLWKNLDYGVFYIGSASSSVVNLKAADNGVGVFQFIMGPAALAHRYADKYANVKNSLIIGTSDELNCSTGLGDRSDFNIAVSNEKIKFHSSPLRIGITMPTFSSGSNACPNMPCNGIMSYQTIKGIFKLQGKGVMPAPSVFSLIFLMNEFTILILNSYLKLHAKLQIMINLKKKKYYTPYHENIVCWCLKLLAFK